MQSLIITEKVSVVFENYPKIVTWKGRDHKIKRLGFHHKYKEGDTLFHIFSVVSDTLFFRLKLNSTNLSWILEEVSDAV